MHTLSVPIQHLIQHDSGLQKRSEELRTVEGDVCLDDAFRALDLYGDVLEVRHSRNDVVDGEGEAAGCVDAEREVGDIGEDEDSWGEDWAGLDVFSVSYTLAIALSTTYIWSIMNIGEGKGHNLRNGDHRPLHKLPLWSVHLLPNLVQCAPMICKPKFVDLTPYLLRLGIQVLVSLRCPQHLRFLATALCEYQPLDHDL